MCALLHSPAVDLVGDVRFGSLADILRCGSDVRFTPENGHVQCNSVLSAKCQKRTLPELFDDFVSASKEPLWHFEAKRFSRLKIYGEFVLGWRLHWKVTRFLALKDAIDVVGPGTKGVDRIGAIRRRVLRP